MQTNLDGVFAAGDIVRGTSCMLTDGRDVKGFYKIEKYLKTKINKDKSSELHKK